MNHSQYKEWLTLADQGELTEEQSRELESHLSTCAECRAEREALRSVDSMLKAAPLVDVSDGLLNQARQELRVLLRRERNKGSFESAFLGWLDSLMAPPVRYAVTGAVTLVVGLLAGYAVFAPVQDEGDSPWPGMTTTAQYTGGESQITAVRFIDADASDGEVEFAFQAVKPMRVRGNTDDPEIQRLLAYALLGEQNPGVRIRTVSTLASKPVESDPEIKNALLQVLKFDLNAGVRKEALKALQAFPLDQETKEVLIYVLANDPNEGVRIDAINFLSSAKIDPQQQDSQEILNTLRTKMETDHNTYIRLRARAVLEEVQP